MSSEPKPPAATGIDALPSPVRKPLSEWIASLEAALGDELVAVLAHGSILRGEYRPGESDVGAVVVLAHASFANLEAMAPATQSARYTARVSVTIVTGKEIAGASDVFPLLYDEIKRRHLLLFGRDPFKVVEVQDTHRRLRIEQELRAAQIGLRRAVVDAAGAREAVGGAVLRKIRQVRRALHALLAMNGVACAEDLASVIKQAAETYGVDAAALGAPRQDPEAAHAALERLLDAAVDDVDARG